MSSFQICRASRAGLPLAESPPVSAIPKPILMGSAARATNTPAPASTTAPMTTEITTQLRTRCLQGCFIASILPLLAAPTGARRSYGRAKTAPVGAALSRRWATRAAIVYSPGGGGAPHGQTARPARHAHPRGQAGLRQDHGQARRCARPLRLADAPPRPRRAGG